LVIAGINIFIQDGVEYINLVRDSCPCNTGIKNIIQDILEYIDVVAASCLGNRGIKYVNDTCTE
jgi:hypothetical protein